MFVLTLFCEIKSNYVHPILHKRTQEIKDKLEKEQLKCIKPIETINALIE